MVDDAAEAVELAESEVDRFIMVCHKTLNYWQILKLFLLACEKLYMMSEVEYYLKLRG